MTNFKVKEVLINAILFIWSVIIFSYPQKTKSIISSRALALSLGNFLFEAGKENVY